MPIAIEVCLRKRHHAVQANAGDVREWVGHGLDPSNEHDRAHYALETLRECLYKGRIIGMSKIIEILLSLNAPKHLLCLIMQIFEQETVEHNIQECLNEG